ncbi:MAG: gliding motility-associated C-terminal domain-containing protein [Flavobacteriales bacterium]|nr:gliding motility-associated C-terminal domain-containing protein [Flavobacteriales bacterium]MCW8911729.1 gliding motility-associated C-terminal domain-containing protein [Flavobacteriales bacterium]MCW8936988.1 gliding motility-associated C-terminal domain-containing protein [Flavobacteriales bacterium]MCW8939888.1 gliding motility-associated C-terminal domain-containing protein [Flavobacteriales bacterium]MCW8968774.1 gliding motility-associated C-terminal domain-containing protein [Flavob
MKKILSITLAIIFSSSLFSQITILENDTTICSGSLTFNATVLNSSTPTSVSLSDDTHSGVVPIGFTFNYYGTNNTQCVISSNNYITFNLANANNFSPWAINFNVPDASTTEIHNAVLGPWQDINPGAGGNVRYATVGTAPNRIFVVEYCNIPMFSCTNLQFSSQIQLHENGNRVQTHIISKPLCTTWNTGQAIHATHNNGGTQATVVTGRNANSQWTVNNEGREFSWNGTTYTESLIPFSPIILGNPNNIQWTEVGNSTILATGPTVTVTPTTTTAYVASVTGGCAGIPFTDTVYVTVGAGNFNFGNSVVTNPPCTANTGSITVNINGGSGTYGYSWNTTPTQTTQTISNLGPGSYMVTVTDSVSGCTKDTTFVVTNGSSLQATIDSSFNVSCNGGNDGIAYANTSGGTGSVTYSWNTNPVQTTQTATGLAAGTYSVTVTDSVGCIYVATVVITEPNTLVANPTMTAMPTCNGGSDGTAIANASGGTTPYSYSWNTTPVQTTQSASGLSVGQYTLTVTDSNGCVSTGNVLITQPAPISNSIQITNITCHNGNDGAITLTSSGGTAPYSYSWSTSANTSNTETGLSSGIVYVTTSDNQGCSVTDTIQITNPDSMSLTLTHTSASCNTDDGTATAVVVGGSAPYNYLWSVNNQTTQTADSLPGGMVSVVVMDANGCTVSGSINIDTVNIHTAVAGADPTTGIAPLIVNFSNNSQNTTTYFWDFGDGNTSTDFAPTHTYLENGTYVVVLTSINSGGCMAYDTLIIDVINELIIPNVFTPNGDGVNDNLVFKNLHAFPDNKLIVLNRWGKTIFEKTGYQNDWGGDGHSDGTYFFILELNDKDNTVHKGTITILRD